LLIASCFLPIISLIPSPGEGVVMIQLTRLNNARLALNCDLIKYVEAAPDTVITLLNGEKLVVRETTEQVIERVRDFRRSVLLGTAAESLPSGSLASASDADTPRTRAADAEGPERG
jgi:flagellar protein FlbD